MNRTSILTLGCSLLAVAQLYAQAPDYRPWTDKATGKQIEASMVSADSTARTVTILSKDGKSFTLPIARLVDADLAYIKQKLSEPASTPPPTTTPATAETKTKGKPAPATAPAGPVGQPAPARPTVAIVPAKKYKFPAGNAVLGAVKKERPRLLLNAAGMAAVKARLDSDATAKALFASLKATAEKVIELPELVQVRGEASRGASVGAKAIFRMTGLGILNYVDEDPRWKDYAVREMVSISSFTNWHPEELADNAEFVWGMAIGYDMFRKSMNADQEKKIKTALLHLGMESLIASFKGEEFPSTTKRSEPGQAPFTKPFPNKRPAVSEAKEPDSDEMLAACALLMGAIALAEEEPSKAGPAASLACKVIHAGISRFAPDGIWAEGVHSGDDVLDALGSLIMTLRAATGSDFGLSTVEGLQNAGLARMHLSGPAGVFNYGDARGTSLSKTWVTSFLASQYGNPGIPALKAPKGADSTETQGMGLAGQVLYHSPFMSGYGTPEALDASFVGAGIATLRSAWNDPAAYFVAIKGGTNNVPGGQLDLGTFVLDAGGVRWAVDLGAENDRAMKDHVKPVKFKNYRENTFGQNTWRFGPGLGEKEDYKPVAPKKGPPDPPKDSQPLDAKAPLIGFSSTPDRGAAIIDLTDAYSTHTKDFHRGVMVSRGAAPYVVIQDELKIKGGEPEWVMHTQAEVTIEGNRALLKRSGKTLVMTLISPLGVTMVAEDPPAQPTANSPLTGFKVIKIPLKGMKGKDTTVSVSFALGDTSPNLGVTPLAQWLPKKR